MLNFKIPGQGDKIIVKDGSLITPDFPIILFIEGDGTGPDIWRASKRVFDAAVKVVFGDKKKIMWAEIFAGEKAVKNYGAALPEETLKAIRDYAVAIKGPLTTPVGEGERSLNVAIRQKLDLYACIRPCKWIEGVPSPVINPRELDVVIFRENTEDLYAGIEWPYDSKEVEDLKNILREKFSVVLDKETGIGIKPISSFKSKRLVRKAIKYALTTGRNKVTLVHKGNIMKYTEGAFRKWGYEVAKDEFSEYITTDEELKTKYNGKIPKGKILINDIIADNMFQQILLRPSEYSVIATTNLNGDYLSDACAAQVGGLGMAPGANIGDNAFIFEATHGTAPKYANLDKVNPGSLILSGVMMFEYMGWNKVGETIFNALKNTIQDKIVTYDLARGIKNVKEVKTSEFADEIMARM